VAMHGGTVQARSPGPGRGSEFVVTLPVLAQPAVRTEPPRSVTMFPPRRILVVDDNQDAADTLGSLLTALGATVAVVHSGEAALEAFATFNPDTVLLDLGMPGMDGFDVARKIRALEGHPDTLLIALTGWGQDHDYRQSRAAGFDHHLVKPPDIERLRELLSAGWTAPPAGPAEASAADKRVRPTRH
jgi:CheY-like chemotaxis protein